MPLFAATAHTAQNLLRISMNRSFLVWHEYHCNPTLGIVWVFVTLFGPTSIQNHGDNGDALMEAVCSNRMLFLFLICCIECARYTHISFPRNSSLLEYIRLCIPGTSMSASVEFKRVTRLTLSQLRSNALFLLWEYTSHNTVLCVVNKPMESRSWSVFTMQQPLSGLQTVCVVVAACVVVGLLFSLFSLAELALAIAAFTLLLL